MGVFARVAAGFAPFRGRLLLLVIMIVAALPAAAQMSVEPPRDPPMQIEVNKGRVIRLPRPAATVFIADPEIADVQVKSPTLVYVIGMQPGETTLYAADEAESMLASVEIRVVHNLGRLRREIGVRYPDMPITLASVGNSIVVDGAVPTPVVAEDIARLARNFLPETGEVINRLAVTAPVQVNLRVRVAEVQRSARKQLGFNWNVNGTVGSFAFGLATGNPFAVAQDVTPDVIAGALDTANWDANVAIDALADEGMITVLAEPNLTTLSGETASFLAGGEFPILVPQGDFRVTIEFKPFGVSVAFTPTILNGKRISMRVRPEVSELTQDGAVDFPFGNGTLQVPALRVRRAETTVELGSGQSFAIAGLLQNNTIQGVHKLPGLGDIPVLGQLFRSDDFQRDETELVIIVTPYIVRPAANPAVLAEPSDGFSPPSDVERLVYGGTHRRNPDAGAVSLVTPDGSRVVGTIGFILE